MSESMKLYQKRNRRSWEHLNTICGLWHGTWTRGKVFINLRCQIFLYSSFLFFSVGLWGELCPFIFIILCLEHQKHYFMYFALALLKSFNLNNFYSDLPLLNCILLGIKSACLSPYKAILVSWTVPPISIALSFCWLDCNTICDDVSHAYKSCLRWWKLGGILDSCLWLIE